MQTSTPIEPRPAWEAPAQPGRFSAETTAQRVGHYLWIAQRLFEFTGGWVATVPEAELKPTLGAHCYHQAFHAELWHKRLPSIAQLADQDLCQAANPQVEALFAAVAEPMDADLSIEKLVGFYRVVLPAVISAYTFHLNNAATVSDAPTIRALRLCLADNMEDWREGEMMVQRLVTSPEEADRAADRHRHLTKLLLVAGGILGEDGTSF